MALVLVVLTMAFGSMAWADDQEVKNAYNAALESVVQEIQAMKNGYPELEGFSSAAIQQDGSGFNTLLYNHDSSGTTNNDPYGYSLSIISKPYNSGDKAVLNENKQEMVFPLLSIKVVMEAQKKGTSTSFDARKIVESSMDGLKDLEQKFLPFQLDLKAQKESFEVYEDIVVTASLNNYGVKGFRVAAIDENSLYCNIGEIEWGNPDGAVEFNSVLNPKSSLATMLTIPGVDTPQDVWISCKYAIAFKGVQPYKRIKISIKPKS